MKSVYIFIVFAETLHLKSKVGHFLRDNGNFGTIYMGTIYIKSKLGITHFCT